MKYHRPLFVVSFLFSSHVIAAPEDDIASAIDTMQKAYNSTTGLWRGVKTQIWWESANILTTIAKFGTHDPEFKPKAIKIVQNTFEKSRNVPREIGGYQNWKNEFTDDMGWWALAWIASYDLTSDTKYLNAAVVLFNDMQTNAATECDGLIKWKIGSGAITAISNEIFLSVAAHLANRVPTDQRAKYRARAEKQWQDFSKPGRFINGKKLINDGIRGSNCTNNGGNTWTYNQGVILGGLAELAKATKNKAYTDRASELADGTLKHLSPNGILTEPVPDSHLDQQAAQFKGAFVRGLAALNAQAPDAKYAAYLKNNAESAWEKAKPGNVIGSKWQGGGKFTNTTSHASGIDVLVASAQANKGIKTNPANQTNACPL